MTIKLIKEKILQSKLFKDSFWAVFGNGFGNALMLFSGIIIARLLGKDLYGEKNTERL
jgi:O-antigen/teichoic acid export membrane protein